MGQPGLHLLHQVVAHHKVHSLISNSESDGMASFP
jgi:hypothetical protein